MSDAPLIRIATHDGKFHQDDVLAVAILTTLYPHHQVIRTRDSDILDMMDFVVDVGDVYDHTLRRYDHHMHATPRDHTGHLYSSAGLVWRHYAKSYLRTIGIPSEYTLGPNRFDLMDAVEKNIRFGWIHPIDRADNGVTQGFTPISEIVRALRPIDPERSRARCDALFIEAVSMVSHIFKRSCFHSTDVAIDKLHCANGEKIYLRDGKIVVTLQKTSNYKSFGAAGAHFVISPVKEYKDADPYFVIRPMIDTVTKNYKTAFPFSCWGTRRETIEATLGVKGISFIHHCGFLGLADTQEAAIRLCEQLLETG